MAKKRERRVGPSSDRSKTRVEASTQKHELGDDSVNSDRRQITIFIIFFIVIPAVSMLVYSIKHTPRPSNSFVTVSGSVHERGLVKLDINHQQILTEQSRVLETNGSHRHFKNPVLAYITPWNSMGYEMAKKFNSKFTHLSPVWYDLKSQGNGLVLEGRHNADVGWIKELRLRGHAQLLPRVVLEAFPKEILKKKKLKNKAIDLMVTECKEMEYDGIVLESWSRWAAYGILLDPDLRNLGLQFIKQLGEALHSVNSARDKPLQLIYVIGPPYSEKLQAFDFGPKDLQSLSGAVDGFSLMTYDYSNPHNPGPNAPLKWISFCLQMLLADGARSLAHKIFLGINFYGNDFILSEDSGGGAITGRDYLSILEKHKPVIQWEKKSSEHFFYYDDKNIKHAVFYPSLMSIYTRLEEARSWGTGISIWEIGQGLEYFFDLL
ncbi:hypothetical protein ACFE04_016818 [Oxalis oulophora]